MKLQTANVKPTIYVKPRISASENSPKPDVIIELVYTININHNNSTDNSTAVASLTPSVNVKPHTVKPAKVKPQIAKPVNVKPTKSVNVNSFKPDAFDLERRIMCILLVVLVGLMVLLVICLVLYIFLCGILNLGCSQEQKPTKQQ